MTCVVKGCPIGLGQPVYGKLQSALAAGMLSINAAKAFEYGEGFKGLKMKGSEQNDVFFNNNGRIETHTNTPEVFREESVTDRIFTSV